MLKYIERLVIYATFQNCTCDEDSLWFTLDSVKNPRFNEFIGADIKPYSSTQIVEDEFYNIFLDTTIKRDKKFNYKIVGFLHKYKEIPIFDWLGIGGTNPYKFETELIEMKK